MSKLLFIIVPEDEPYNAASEILGDDLHATFSLDFDLTWGALSDLQSKYKVGDVVVFVGSYTGYDYSTMLSRLDALGYRRSGSSYSASCIINSKLIMGGWFEARGLRTVLPIDNSSHFPCVVKRSDSCGSWDQTVVRKQEDLLPTLHGLAGRAIVIEPFVYGLEVSINFMGSHLTSWYEIHVKDSEVLDKEKKDSRAKWLSVHDFHSPSYDTSLLHKDVVDVIPTLQAFLMEIGAKDVCRFDIRLCSTTGKLQVMDVNNVACCNFEFLTAHEKAVYVDFIKSLF